MEEKETDYYALLEIEITSTAKEIERAYRKKALKVHPDKNPSPDAATLFHNLTVAYESLTNVQKRNDYDQKHRARQERMKKKNEMDFKRRKAQDELEKRENEAKKQKMNQNEAKAKYEAELSRLREEGAKRRQDDWNAENRTKQEELPKETELDCALKFKWKRKKYDFSEKDLENMLGSLANVDTVALSQKKKGSALVVFKTVVDAHSIMMKKDVHQLLSQFEIIDWATGKIPALVERMNRVEELKKQAKAAYYNTNDRKTAATGKPLFATNSTHSFFKSNNIPSGKISTPVFDYDYESITLMKMRQAERDRVLLLQSYNNAQSNVPDIMNISD